MTRVLYVIDSLEPGGAESSLAALAPWYAKLGVGLDVAYLKEGPGVHDRLRAAGVTLHPLAGGGGRLGWVRRARRLVAGLRPDLVHTTLYDADVTGRVAARLAGVPVVTSLVNVTYGPAHVDDPNLSRWRVRAAQLADIATSRLTVRFHAVSRHVAGEMARNLRLRPDRIDVVYRGRDPATLGTRTPERGAAARARLEVDEGTPLLVAVGRQEHQKGLDLLVEAMPAITARVPGVRLVVAGRDGNQSALLTALVERHDLGPSVAFLGHRDDAADLLAAADAFVMPSRREGLPGALLEAMALDAPAVVTDLPQVREVVSDAEAVLVPPDDATTLADAVVGVLTDRGGATRRAAAARQRFLDTFTLERAAEGMVAFYERALAAAGGRRSR